MTTTRKRRWWPSWRRQQSAPRRLERTKSDFGYKCVIAIYKTLLTMCKKNCLFYIVIALSLIHKFVISFINAC